MVRRKTYGLGLVFAVEEGRCVAVENAEIISYFIAPSAAIARFMEARPDILSPSEGFAFDPTIQCDAAALEILVSFRQGSRFAAKRPVHDRIGLFAVFYATGRAAKTPLPKSLAFRYNTKGVALRTLFHHSSARLHPFDRMGSQDTQWKARKT